MVTSGASHMNGSTTNTGATTTPATAGERDRDRDGGHRDAMYVHAHQVRHLEVVRRRADREAEARAVEHEPDDGSIAAATARMSRRW